MSDYFVPFDDELMARLLSSDAVNRTVFFCDYWAELYSGYSVEVNEAAARLFDEKGARRVPCP